MNFSKYMKKFPAFTLGEILIVLTIIGFISAITVPQMTGNIEESRYRAGYKKAFNVISNITSQMKSEGTLPNNSTQQAGFEIFSALVSNLDVEGYADSGTAESNVLRGGKIIRVGQIYTSVTYNGVTFGEGESAGTFPLSANSGQWSPWIITSDGLAYAVKGTGGACKSKAYMNGPNATEHETWLDSCVLVAVDVNGVAKGPNLVEPQISNVIIERGTSMKKLSGDIYFIYIGNDGAAAGGRDRSACGRILADMK